MLKELQDIGLSEKEAKVYLAALEIGRATADQLAKQANIVRSTTYVQLESLMKKGLMSTYEEVKKTFFAPESPELLKRLLLLQREQMRVKETELDSLLPGLLQQFNGAGERPVVRFFSGKEGVTAMREEILSLKRGEEYLILFSRDNLSHIYTQKELDDFSDKRAASGIKSRYIYTRQGGKSTSELPPDTERRYLPPEKLPMRSDIFVYRNRVAIMALNTPVFGIVIESSEIAESFRAIFGLLWEVAEA
jgi:HTH-type transcriptional regulator, sugar sensing transcriptional regulator